MQRLAQIRKTKKNTRDAKKVSFWHCASENPRL